MNKSLALLALPALLLTGCASGAPMAGPATGSAATTAAPSTITTPKPTPTPTPTPTTKKLTREEQVNEIYLDNVYKSEPALRAADAGEDLISIGQGFCKMYDGGAKGSDVNDFILTAAGWAYTVKQLVAVHGSAVGAFCPEHIEKIGT